MSDSTESDWAKDLWPDDGADPDWPGDWPRDPRTDEAHWRTPTPVPAMGGVSRPRGPWLLGLMLTAAIALAAGAGAVYAYQHAQRAATAGSSTSAAPGSSPSGGAVTTIGVLAAVVAIGHNSITVGGGPAPSISAEVTSATRFTGAARSLAQVRVGDMVAAQIAESGGVARVVSLQDPASRP